MNSRHLHQVFRSGRVVMLQRNCLILNRPELRRQRLFFFHVRQCPRFCRSRRRPFTIARIARTVRTVEFLLVRLVRFSSASLCVVLQLYRVGSSSNHGQLFGA